MMPLPDHIETLDRLIQGMVSGQRTIIDRCFFETLFASPVLVVCSFIEPRFLLCF
jgi:hypothetical protein